jgi:hypothetical protein
VPRQNERKVEIDHSPLIPPWEGGSSFSLLGSDPEIVVKYGEKNPSVSPFHKREGD